MANDPILTLPGPGATPFSEALRGVAVDKTGTIYLVGDHRVDVYDGKTAAKLRTWPTPAEGLCVAVDGEGLVCVGGVGRVDVFDAQGRSVRVWRDEHRLGRVSDIAFFGDNVLVADTQQRCIHRFDRSGTWRNDIGTGHRLRGFFIPNGHLDFAVDHEGVVHACDPGKYRVERFSLEGELLGHFGRWGNRSDADFGGCCNPTNLALAGDTHVVVSEKAPPRVKVYDQSGGLVSLIDPSHFDPNCKNMDLAVDGHGHVLVVDTARRQLLVFKMPSPAGKAAPANASSTGDSKP